MIWLSLDIQERSVSAMAAARLGTMVTVKEAVPVQPLAAVTVTVYVVVIVGATVMVAVVAALLHK